MLNRLSVNALLKSVIALMAAAVIVMLALGSWDSWRRLQSVNRITVAAVDFLPASAMLQPVPSGGITEYLMSQTGTFVKALAILAAAIILVWFGLRPARF